MLATWPFGDREALSIADWTPSCNVSETPEEYRVEAELPGVKQEDLEVNVENRLESSYGSFMRSFTLPDDADDDKVAAEYKDGLLTVRVMRTEPKESTARRIQIGS